MRVGETLFGRSPWRVSSVCLWREDGRVRNVPSVIVAVVWAAGQPVQHLLCVALHRVHCETLFAAGRPTRFGSV